MTTEPRVTTVEVAIIGAGFAGIAAAIGLGRAGVRDLVVLEAAPEVGGTWEANTYPGAACDIRTSLYSLSAAPEPGWTRRYPTQPEIQAYLRAVADRAGLRHVLRTSTTVCRAVWDELARRWELHTQAGHLVRARFVVLAIGGLRVPAFARVPGLERFRGTQFHTARYDHTVDLRGRRVGVIGTGASAAQLVPALAGIPAELHVFQRTAPWVIPRNDRPRRPVVRAAARHVPGWRELDRLSTYLRNEARILGFRDGTPLSRIYGRLALGHLARQVPDRDLRRALTPTTPLGCKRVVISDDYYPALMRDDVHLQPGVVAADGETVTVADGRRVGLDVLIHATGFAIDQQLAPLELHGRDGARLDGAWQDRPRTHLGIGHPGFPNLFQLLGPNSALGHNSVLVMIEAQVRYLLDAIALLERRGLHTIEPTPQAADRYLAEVDRRHRRSVWTGCRSWYVDDDGRNVALWPGASLVYRRMTRRVDPADHRLA